MPSTYDRISALAPLTKRESNTTNPGVVLTERHPLIMLNLRGGKDPAFYKSAQLTLGFDLPPALGSSGNETSGKALWLAPGEWLIVATPPTSWSDSMTLDGGTLTDVSHGRVVVNISGPSTREVLTKGCMLDLHPQSFPSGMCAQTSIAKINVVIYRPGNSDEFDLFAPRSYAHSFWCWLVEAASEYGCRTVPG